MKNKGLILAALAGFAFYLYKKKNPTLVAQAGMPVTQATTPGSAQDTMIALQNVGLSGVGSISTKRSAVNLIEQRKVDVMPHGYQQLENPDVIYDYAPNYND